VVDEVLAKLDAPEPRGLRLKPALKLAGAAALGAPALAGLLQASTAHPAGAIPPVNNTYVVNILGDPNPTDVTGGACLTSGPCTFRQAVNQFNMDGSSADDTITFSVAGTFGLGAKLFINNSSSSLTIDGNGPSNTIISVGTFGIGAKAFLDMSGVQITGGSSPSHSAFTNYDYVNLFDSLIAGNSAMTTGGAISTSGYLVATNDTFSGNSASTNGGAVYNTDVFAATNDTFFGNSAGTSGGAVYNANTFEASNDTFSGNSDPGGGGAIYNSGTATVTASILAGNPPAVADNTPNNCAGTASPPVTDGGFNVADDPSCGFGGPGANVSDSLIALSPLANNGGPTQTEAIPSSSVAASNVTTCPTSTDQRGKPRPATNCSAGAYQFVVPPFTGGVAPTDPLNLTATDGAITLNWQPPVSGGTAPVTSYDVFRFTATTAATQIATVNAPTTTYVDSSVVAGTTYSYYVEAVNQFGTSPPSNVVSITPTSGNGPSPPASTSCTGSSGNAAFVCAMYEDLLGRAPDPSGSASWQAALSSGQSRSQVALGVMSSAEYFTGLVASYYESFLGRAPDSGGLSTFESQLASGATDEQVIAGIVASQEFYSDAGSTNTGFVNALYEDLLGRAADPAGSSSWQSQLVPPGGGACPVTAPNCVTTSRMAVALGIMSSSEYLTDLVSGYYESYLGRAPDSGGLATFMGQLSSGATDEQVIAAIVGSQEFYNDATGA